MSKLDITSSFGRNQSPFKPRFQSSSTLSLPKTLTHSDMNLNNTSRFQEKKVLRKLHEQDVLNRIQITLAKLTQNEIIAKEAFKFKPVPSNKKVRKQKEN